MGDGSGGGGRRLLTVKDGTAWPVPIWYIRGWYMILVWPIPVWCIPDWPGHCRWLRKYNFYFLFSSFFFNCVRPVMGVNVKANTHTHTRTHTQDVWSNSRKQNPMIFLDP